MANVFETPILTRGDVVRGTATPQFADVDFWSDGLMTPVFSPKMVGGLQAFYDFTDTSSLKVDSSNRVSYAADVSGNSPVNVLALIPTGANYASAPSTSALNINGDIDIRIFVSINDVTIVPQYMFGKWGATGVNASYLFAFESIGNRLAFFYSTNGTTNTTVAQSTVSAGIVNYQKVWLRATMDVDDGAGNNVVTFYKSSDGITWTTIQTITTAGVATIGSSTAPLYINGYNGNASSQGLSGNVYRAQVYNGINGTLAFDANFATASRGASSFTESSANAATVTITSSGDIGARICGERDLAQLTGAKQPLLLPWSGSNYLYSPNVLGNNATTPSTSALNTSDLEFTVRMSMDDWTPSNYQIPLAKYNSLSANDMNWYFQINPTSGTVCLTVSNGTSIITAGNSTVAPTVSDGQAIWIRCTFRPNTGGVSEWKYYTAPDSTTKPTSWTQLGSTVTSTSFTSIYASSGSLRVGSTGASGLGFAGKIYYADFAAYGGSPISVFNPAVAANNASSFVASTGETWTINSTGASPAQIVAKQSVMFDGSNDYFKSPLFSRTQPHTIVFIGKQNLWGAYGTLVDGLSADSANIAQYTSSPNLLLYAGGLGPQSTDLNVKINGVIQAVFNSGSSLLRINRNTAVTTGNVGGGNPNGLTLGCRSDLVQVSTIQVMQVLIYTRVLTIAELDRICLWASSKDAIAV